MLTDRRTIPVLLALTGVVFVIFGVWPGIDLATTAQFHDASGFPIIQQPIVERLRNALWSLSNLVPLLALIGLIVSLFRKGWVLGLPSRIWGFVLALFLLAPGLLVNGILKAYWGRARPTAVTEFGGDALFTPFYEISDQCAKNCSFVSGEGSGSMAMAISALVILEFFRTRLSPAIFRAGQGLTLLMLIFVGFQRVASGGHFLSDVLLSWLFTALVAAVLAKLLLARDTLSPQAQA